MFRPRRQRRSATQNAPPSRTPAPLNYRDRADDARANGNDDPEAFLNPEANWRALKKLAIEVPLGMVFEGVITVLGIAVVIVLIRGCA